MQWNIPKDINKYMQTIEKSLFYNYLLADIFKDLSWMQWIIPKGKRDPKKWEIKSLLF